MAQWKETQITDSRATHGSVRKETQITDSRATHGSVRKETQITDSRAITEQHMAQ